MTFAFDLKKARAALLGWYRAGNRSLPWRELWKRHRDPYHVWVSEIMLQQTVIKAMIPVYARFLEKFPDVGALAAGSEAEVREAVRGLGYYRRFRMMHAAAQELVGRPWPTNFEGWKALPGIGDYTAAAVSSIAFDYPAAVVDGNVERVFCRLLDIREAPNQPQLKKRFKDLAAELLERKAPGDFNQALMELGQLVCTPTGPQCGACPLQFGCLAFERGSQALAPAAKTKPEVRDVAMRLTVLRDKKGRVAIFDRPATARFLKGTHGFLTALGDEDGRFVADGGVGLARGIRTEHAATVKHSITNHRIKVDVRVATAAPNEAPAGATWIAAADVERHLVSNLDRKAWHALQGAR
jgi:A/G-specific adenine glycosylase